MPNEWCAVAVSAHVHRYSLKFNPVGLRLEGDQFHIFVHDLQRSTAAAFLFGDADGVCNWQESQF
jgi:hypothetical protein